MGPFESLVEELFGGYFDMGHNAPRSRKGWLAAERVEGRGTAYSIQLSAIKGQPYVWNSLKKWLTSHFGERVPKGNAWNVSGMLRDGGSGFYILVTFADNVHPRILDSYFQPLGATLVMYRGSATRPATLGAA